MNHPTPPPLPKKHEHEYKKRRGRSLFTSSIAIFITASSGLYLLIDVAHVNVPLYYPTLRMFSYQVVGDVISMPFYGRMLYALVGALGITLIHVVLFSVFASFKLTKISQLNVFATTVFWFVAAVLILQIWNEWGINRRSLDTTAPVNDEFYLAVIGVIVLFGGVLLTALAVKRVASLAAVGKSPGTSSAGPNKSNNGAGI